MATSRRSSPQFRLQFRVVSDGLDSTKAISLNRAGLHAHGGRFPLFSNLPAELRLKIWEYLITPRIVAVACLDDQAGVPSVDVGAVSDEEPEEPSPSFPEFSPPPPAIATPVLLLVNRETRALALSHYEPAFAWKVPRVLLHDSVSSSSSGSGSRPSVWFNYAQDAMYLAGELEPCDSDGVNSPMVYFLSREEAGRVRRLAVAFAALGYGESGNQHIFGALFHVVDRFVGVEGRRVLVAVVPRDEITHSLMGGKRPLVSSKGSGREKEIERGGGEEKEKGCSVKSEEREKEEVNIIQNIWRKWYRGSIVTSSLADVRFELVDVLDLPEHIARPTEPVRVESEHNAAKEVTA